MTASCANARRDAGSKLASVSDEHGAGTCTNLQALQMERGGPTPASQPGSAVSIPGQAGATMSLSVPPSSVVSGEHQKEMPNSSDAFCLK